MKNMSLVWRMSRVRKFQLFFLQQFEMVGLE